MRFHAVRYDGKQRRGNKVPVYEEDLRKGKIKSARHIFNGYCYAIEHKKRKRERPLEETKTDSRVVKIEFLKSSRVSHKLLSQCWHNAIILQHSSGKR